MQYLDIDWGTRRASWCAFDDHGVVGEGSIPAEQDGLTRLVTTLGAGKVRGCIEMTSGAVWVRDAPANVGWQVRLADASKVKAIAPLACKTGRVDARVLADLVRRDLVPEVWVPSLEERANRERPRSRTHSIRLRTSAINRTVGLPTQRGLRRNLTALRKPGALSELAKLGVPATCLQSLQTLLGVIDDLDAQLTPLEQELRPHTQRDPRVQPLMTIPGVAEILGLTLAAELGDISRFPSAKQLVDYSGPAPTIKQSGQSNRTGRISKAGPDTLRWAAVGQGRPTGMAAVEPVAPPLHRRQDPPRQEQSRQGRCRPEGPQRHLARPRARAALQAKPGRRMRRHAPVSASSSIRLAAAGPQTI